MAHGNPADYKLTTMSIHAQYNVSKYLQEDNSPASAEYLGYISARDLFPDFEWISFSDFIVELIVGRIRRPYHT